VTAESIPVLTVLSGGWKADEAHVEALSFMQEVNRDANEILRCERSMTVPNARVVFLSGRMAGRSERVQHELKALAPGDDAA
jgi:predicted protein tyrosine phosphatase